MNREAALPFCVLKSVDFDLRMTSTGEEPLRKGNIQPTFGKADTGDYLIVFEPLSPHFFDRSEV